MKMTALGGIGTALVTFGVRPIVEHVLPPHTPAPNPAPPRPEPDTSNRPAPLPPMWILHVR